MMRNMRITSTSLIVGAIVVAMVTAHLSPEVVLSTTTTDPFVATPTTVVLTCAAEILTSVNSSSNTPAMASVEELSSEILRYINLICRKKTVADRFLGCMKFNLPSSNLPVDRVLERAVNLTRLATVRNQGCTIQFEISNSMQCIVRNILRRPEALQCVTGLGTFFEALSSAPDTNSEQHALTTFCSTWGTMIRCLGPYLDTCDASLAVNWRKFGMYLLADTCRKTASETATPAQIPQETADILSFLNANGSAIMFCSQRFNSEIIKFIPTSVVTQTVMSPEAALAAVTAICSGDIYDFMTCLEEKANSTSPIDVFLFSVINITNTRASYKDLCASIPVIRENMGCLLNTGQEMTSCMCYMGELARRVIEISSNFSYDKLLDPFCSFFVSFSECYIGQLGSCSDRLAILMEKVHLGSLTSTCRAARGTSCSPKGSGPGTGSRSVQVSEMLECGAPVNYHLSELTSGRLDRENVQEMMDQIHYMITDTYRFTCSQREDILQCLREKYLPSTSEFDRLLKAMFDFPTLREAAEIGCNPSLIDEVEKRLQFILSTIMSDPTTTPCLERIRAFSDVLTGEIIVDSSTVEFFCQTWGNLAECLEGKLACSSRDLAQVWRNLTTSALTPSCRDIALTEQRYSSRTGLCDVDPVSDSGLSICWMTHAYLPDKQPLSDIFEHSKDLVTTISRELNHLCHNEGAEWGKMAVCLERMVPHSYLYIDLLVNAILNISSVKLVAQKTCLLEKEIQRHLPCVVESVVNSAEGETPCIRHLQIGFNVTSSEIDAIQGGITEACTHWERFLRCIHHHINSCDHGLANRWTQLTHILTSEPCHARPVSGSGRIYSTFSVFLIFWLWTLLS